MEVSAVMEMFCTVHYGSCQKHEAVEHLKCNWLSLEAEIFIYLILISSNLNSHTCLVAAILDTAGLGKFP